MNVVRLMGGMGNQFFQYAFGQALQATGKEVAYDLSWYMDGLHGVNQAYPRPLRLMYFDISNLKQSAFLRKNPTVFDVRVGFNMGLFELKSDSNFDGYWQYYPYIKAQIPTLKKEFALMLEHYSDPFMTLADELFTKESVSVHVRRGDYLMNRKGKYTSLIAKYFFDALSQVEGDIYIFSDDLPWCRDIFKQEYFDRKIYFIDLPDYQSFELMKLCKHNIISNSTFSYWAAMLNENPSKKVFCPYHFLDKADSGELYYPTDWIKLNDYVTFEGH